jgi:hypothetical protein
MNIGPEKEFTIINLSETGEFSIKQVTGLEVARLLQEISEDYEKPLEQFIQIGDGINSNTALDGSKTIIIKGTQVIPKSVQVVTKLVI